MLHSDFAPDCYASGSGLHAHECHLRKSKKLSRPKPMLRNPTPKSFEANPKRFLTSARKGADCLPGRIFRRKHHSEAFRSSAAVSSSCALGVVLVLLPYQSSALRPAMLFSAFCSLHPTKRIPSEGGLCCDPCKPTPSRTSESLFH